MASINILISDRIYSGLRRRVRIVNGGVISVYPEMVGCTLLFDLVIKPDFYPEDHYRVTVKKNFSEDDPVFIKIFKTRKIISPRTILDFIYDIFTSPGELNIESKGSSNLIEYVDSREFKNEKFDEEILAGLEEVLLGHLKELDNKSKYIKDHIRQGKCYLL